MSDLSFPTEQRWLLLPGLGQTGAYWAPVARWLAADGIALLAADMPALAAACTAPRGSYDRLTEMAHRLADAAAERGISAVVGHSAGAPAALLTTGRRGIRATMLVEPVPEHFGMSLSVPRAGVPDLMRGDSEPAESVQALRRLHPLAAETTLRAIAAATTAGWGRPRSVPASSAGAGRLPAARARAVGDRLGATATPVLVLSGALSAMLPGDLARVLAGQATAGTHRTVARAGHSPHVDRPRETAAALTAWHDEVFTSPSGQVS
ncbi:alpha/beta hydrolase [Streptomyces sp. 5-10]|uniref:alpha/beta fold hydrolase n=1 Tax=Streptomyces sp. 5-10 TaxID=878925 RepID=UPI0019CF1A39|nr:alpha/beta hydrolase [Streptomyces sp. 5-10]MBD3003822.1 alpha/beta hydrolase [Streptomyces sp. 5-10]